MDAREVAAILTAIAAVDDRIDPDSPRVAMWVETLDSTMPFQFAKERVIKHYASSRNVMMPVDLNEPWKIEKQRIKQEQERMALLEIEAEAVPCPDEIRALLRGVAKTA